LFWLLRFQARAAVPVPGGLSTGDRRTIREELFVQVFFVFFASSCFASFQSIESVFFVWKKLDGQSACGGQTFHASWTVCGARPDRPLFKVRYWRFGFHFRTVRPYHADRPPGHRGLSAWCLAELLSPLLLVFHFRFGIV
jgi:hypothetical protein